MSIELIGQALVDKYSFQDQDEHAPSRAWRRNRCEMQLDTLCLTDLMYNVSCAL